MKPGETRTGVQAHYQFQGLIDTGAYDVNGLFPYPRDNAVEPKLEAKVLPGSDLYLNQFMTVPWDDRVFLIVAAPFTTIELSHPCPD